jgi:PncC family amidohydrolase
MNINRNNINYKFVIMEKKIKDTINKLTKIKNETKIKNDIHPLPDNAIIDNAQEYTLSEFLKQPDADISNVIASNSDNLQTSPKSSTSSSSECGLYTVNLEKIINKINIDYLFPVAIAESVTAGALSNTLCSEPGSSKFFLGGIVAYNMKSQEKLLQIDAKYAELNNFANAFTTFDMAKNVSQIFGSRIGLSTTGYSLPLYRPENIEEGKCEIDVKIPYAYFCLYDSQTNYHIVHKITNDEYDETASKKLQRAKMQVKIALCCKKIYDEYCTRISSS